MSHPNRPKGWSTVRLGEVADIRLGKMLDKARTKGLALKYLRNANVRWGKFELNDLLEMPFLPEELERFSICDGDVLVCEGGEPGRAAVWTGGITALKYQKALHRVRLSKAVVPQWLVWCLYLDTKSGALSAQFTGSTIAHLTGEAIQDYALCIAPPREQERILAEVESYFTRLDDTVATLERVERNLKRYRASVLKSAVEGRLVPTEAALAKQEGRDFEPASVLLERILTERRRRWAESGRKGKYEEPVLPDTTGLPELPKGWCWATVDAVGDVLLGRQRAPQYLTGKHSKPYLRVANVKDDLLDLSDIEEMDFDETHFEKYRLVPGDIVVSEGQSPHLVGQSAIYHGGIDGLCFQKTLHRFRPFSPGPSSEFAQLVFRAHVKSGVFMRLASITTNIAHLTLVKFQESRFPLPPEAEQVRIVNECARLMSQIDAAELILRRQLQRCQRLRQSILKWAFEGKLADQDPSDEPASVLLARIKAERDTTQPAKKKSRA